MGGQTVPDLTLHRERQEHRVPFTIALGIFVTVWVAGITSQGGVGGLLFGIPFAAIALYSLNGRSIYKTNRKRRTFTPSPIDAFWRSCVAEGVGASR